MNQTTCETCKAGTYAPDTRVCANPRCRSGHEGYMLKTRHIEPPEFTTEGPTPGLMIEETLWRRVEWRRSDTGRSMWTWEREA